MTGKSPYLPRSSGFTLIELIVTLAIIGLLAALAVPSLEIARQRSKEQELRQALWEIRHAIDAYKRAYDEGKIPNSTNLSGYPPSLQILVGGVENQADPLRRKIYFLRRVPVDPMMWSENNNSSHWGLRSYSSEAESPQQGNDVFDVYSRSDQIGLNNVPYRKW